MAWAYEDWQSALAAEFCAPHHGPTVFFIDDQQLGRLCPEAAEPAADLAGALRSRIRIDDGRTLFAPAMRSLREWQRGDRTVAPPVLPLLAVTVLAASRMRSDAQARSTNYYLRLAQSMAPEYDPDSTENLRNALREGGAFLDVVEMWRCLDEWIEDRGGRVGVSTIRDHPHLPRIGYPLSQALVRQSDRMALTRFFSALDLTPSTVPDASVLADALSIWTAASSNRLSDAFMRALGDADLRPLLASVVEAIARAWDGRILTSEGQQRIAVRVGIDLESWQVRWIFPVVPDGPDSMALVDPNGREINLTAIPGHAYYSTGDNTRVEPDRLLHGSKWRGAMFAAEFPSSPVVLLRLDPQTGAWTSTSGLLPHEEHLVAVSTPHVGELQQVLSDAAADGWRVIPQRGTPLLTGFALFANVRFTDGEALERALEGLPGLRRAGLAPTVVPRARLVRGLPLAGAISAKHYLVGGEPDLLLPSGPDPHIATVTLDGRREQLHANGFPLELRRFVHGPGPHVVDVDGQRLSFVTMEEGPDPAIPVGTGALGWFADGELREGVGSPGSAIIGAYVDTAPCSIPVLARRGRDESWLLHENGEAELLTDPGPPAFLESTDIQFHLPFFEVSPPATARWLAQRRGRRWRLTEIGPSEPKEFELDVDVINAWKRACRDANAAQLWKAQLALSGVLA